MRNTDPPAGNNGGKKMAKQRIADEDEDRKGQKRRKLQSSRPLSTLPPLRELQAYHGSSCLRIGDRREVERKRAHSHARRERRVYEVSDRALQVRNSQKEKSKTKKKTLPPSSLQGQIIVLLRVAIAPNPCVGSTECHCAPRFCNMSRRHFRLRTSERGGFCSGIMNRWRSWDGRRVMKINVEGKCGGANCERRKDRKGCSPRPARTSDLWRRRARGSMK